MAGIGDLGPSYLPTSHIASEIESPTDARGMMAPYMGDPQQMYQFLMDPQNQEHMKQFGVHFNPDTIHESPFFSQHFMQQHPQLGGRLSAGMASVAATPQPEPVSGAGSGMSRAMQGAMGGPQMLREYQNRQLQGPMQQMGMQIPPMEFQRKQALLGEWSKMMGSTEDARTQEMKLQQEAETRKGQEDLQKQQLGQQKIEATRPIMSPYGVTSYQEGQPAQPGIPSPEHPELRGTPAVPGGWQTKPWSEAAPGAGYYPGKPAPSGGRNTPADRAGANYQTRLGNYEGWISKVQGNQVPAMGQEGSTTVPPVYWKDMDENARAQFMQQQQQLKQQWENEYHQQAGGQPYSYGQNQPIQGPQGKPNAGQSPVATGKPQAPPQAQGPMNFNQPPAGVMNPQYGQQNPQDQYQGLDPQYIQSLQQFGY